MSLDTSVGGRPYPGPGTSMLLGEGAWLAVSVQGELVGWSQQASKEMGFRREEILGCSFYDLCARDCVDRARALVRSTVQQGEDRGHLVLRTRIGQARELTVHAAAVPGAGGAAELLVFQLHDPQDLRHRREILQTWERQQAILEAAENLGLGFVMTVEDPGSGPRIVYANQPAAELLGEDRSELRAGSAFERIAPEEHQRLIGLREIRRRSGQRPRFLKTTALRPDGTRVPVEVGLSTCEYQGREATFAVFRPLDQGSLEHRDDRAPQAPGSDQSSSLSSRDTAPELASEVEEALEASASHVYRLLEGLGTVKATHPPLEGLHHEARDLASATVDGLWRARAVARLLRLTAGPRPEADTGPRTVLGDVLSRAAQEIRAQLDPEKGPQLLVRGGAGAAAVVDMEALRLEEALLAVLDNAVEAAGPGGTVVLEAWDPPDGAEIVVTDNGPGMSETARRMAVEPFFTTKPRALGVGLTLACSLLEAAGGELLLHTGGGSGTRVTLRLPLAREAGIGEPGDPGRRPGDEKDPGQGGHLPGRERA